jgi:hypothetical protein
MAFSTYSELKTEIANFLARDDLTTQIPSFITLAEARMSRELNSRTQEKRANATTTSGDGFISLPTDLRSIRNVQLNTDPITILQYNTAEMLNREYNSGGTGKPKAYTIIGSELAIRPIPDTAYTLEIIYGESLNSLSDTTTNNTILTRHPDAYLYGSLTNAYSYLMDEQRATTYDALFTRIMSEIIKDTEDARYGGVLSMKTTYRGT